METNENKDKTIQKSLGYSKSSPKREIHCNTSLPHKIGKKSNTQGNLTPKGIGERTASKTYTKQKRRDKRFKQNLMKYALEELQNRSTKPEVGSFKN